MEAAYQELRRRLGVVTDLNTAAELLFWDQTVMMPPTGARVRAGQLETIQRLAHEHAVDDEVGRLLEQLRPLEESLPYDSDEASLIRVARHDWEKARRVPPELAAEITRVASEAMEAWVQARAASDFESFRPWLERTLELKRRYVHCFEADGDPYDLLLDDYEPGMRTEEVRAVFDRLREVLPGLIDAAASDEQDAFLSGPFPEDAQLGLSLELLRAWGFTEDSWRLDRTIHPFCSSSGSHDIRLTTRYAEDDLTSLFTAMHEMGHGLYEHGVADSLEGTPLGTGCSSALHESQSRLWENVVGRSLPFWRWFHPRAQAAFPDVLGDVDVEQLHRAVNRVRRSFIRVDADEATYGLHIILRFELEQELLFGDLAVADLPEAWNARFREFMGVDVPEDRLGVLQDVHWSSGSFGYFPTYQLGNVVSVQIWERVREALPGIDAQLEQGEFGPLAAWLEEHVYRHGRKFTPRELLERVVGGPIDPEPYIRYLESKFGSAVAA
ncbi:MAG TPA: carboxypeptidase M32 [Gaiellaceae bacterium]|nr:carboxypeptidase M32 [Gaiellaceae bacterium]